MTPTIIDRGRGPEIAGTRITVYTILDYLQAGWHHTAIAALFRISSEEVRAAVQYIEEHKEDVLRENQKILDRIAQGNPPELQAKLDESHARFVELMKHRRAANGNGEGHAGNTAGQ
jgi:uncharacterized protein (DUF433 family)